MKRLFCIIIAAIPLLATAQEPLTLEEALRIALENNFDIKLAENSLEIARNNHSIGNAGFLPSAEANFNRDYGITTFEQRASNGDERSGESLENNSLVYGASLDWTIFDGLRMFRSHNQLKTIQQLNQDHLRLAIETLSYNLSTLYYQAALEEARLRVFEGNLTLSDERMRLAFDKYELGKTSKMEYLQSQVDYNADQSALVKQKELLARAKYTLLEVMAVARDTTDFALQYDLDIVKDLELNELMESMQMTNPRLLALRKNELVAQYNKKINQAERFPELSVYVDAVHRESENPSGFFVSSNSNNLNYGLSARINIFNGFDVNRRIQNAEIDISSSQLQYDKEALNLETRMRQTYLNYVNNLHLLQLEQNNISIVKENNELTRERYEIGLSTALEFREAQLNLINAELRQQNALFAAKLAEIELKYLSGGMSKNL